MASKSTVFDILVKTRDLSSGKLNKISKSLRNTGKAGKAAGVDIKQFNRTLFATTAFIGTVQRAFMGMASVMDLGSQVNRLDNQVSKYFGSKGALFSKIREFTDNSIDRMEAMKSALSLRKLGITKDLQETAHLIAQAGTAGKLAGLDSAEGIKRFTKFMEDGAITHLAFLKLIRKTDPALQAELSILKATTGILGGMISTQAKLTIARRALARATKGQMKGQRDLRDTLKDLSQAFLFAKVEIGTFLNKALQPVLEKFIDLFDSLSLGLETIAKTDKNIVFLGRTLLTAGAAAGGLVAALITLKLTAAGLLSLGIGIPALTLGITLLTGSFLALTSGGDSLVERFKILGAIFRGTFQLIHSFLSDPENFAKGIGKMNAELNALLKKEGLLGFVENLARGTVLAVKFGQGIVDGIVWSLKQIGSAIEKPLTLVRELFGIDVGVWSRSWMTAFEQIGKVVGGAAVALGTLLLAAKSLSKVGGIFGSFGGFGKTAKGGLGKAAGAIGGGFGIPVRVVNWPTGFSGGGGGGGAGRNQKRTRGGFGTAFSIGRSRGGILRGLKGAAGHGLGMIRGGIKSSAGALKGIAGAGGLLSLLSLGFTVKDIAEISQDESLSKQQKAEGIGGQAGGLSGGIGGALAGGTAGAAIGSVFPIIGTAAGALVGSIIGGLAGSKGGKDLGEAIGGFAAKRWSSLLGEPVSTSSATKTEFAIPDTSDKRIQGLGKTFENMDESSEKQKILKAITEANAATGDEKLGEISRAEYKVLFEMMAIHLEKIAGNTESKESNLMRRMSGGSSFNSL